MSLNQKDVLVDIERFACRSLYVQVYSRATLAYP